MVTLDLKSIRNTEEDKNRREESPRKSGDLEPLRESQSELFLLLDSMILKKGHCRDMIELETLIDKYKATLEAESPGKKDQSLAEDQQDEEQPEP